MSRREILTVSSGTNCRIKAARLPVIARNETDRVRTESIGRALSAYHERNEAAAGLDSEAGGVCVEQGVGFVPLIVQKQRDPFPGDPALLHHFRFPGHDPNDPRSLVYLRFLNEQRLFRTQYPPREGALPRRQ